MLAADICHYYATLNLRNSYSLIGQSTLAGMVPAAKMDVASDRQRDDREYLSST